MAVATNLFRRGAVYYFRRRVRWRSGQIQPICLSLRTRCLHIARERAIHLSAACERLRLRLDAAMTDQLPTAAQRAQIFKRQLAAERDSLHALHVRMLARGDACSGRDFLQACELMAQVARYWAVERLPDEAEIVAAGGLEAYIAQHFPEFDDVDQWELCQSLGAPDIIQHWFDLGSEVALRDVGAEVNRQARVAALSEIMTAKFLGIDLVTKELTDLSSRLSAAPMDSLPRAETWSAFDDLALDPLYQLMNMRAPTADRPAASVGQERAEGGGQQQAGLEASGPAAMTIVQAAQAYVQEKPKAGGGSASSKRKKWDPKTLRQFNAAAMLAGKAIPGPIGSVTHADILRLNALFDRLPSSHHKTPRHASMTLVEIADEAARAVASGQMPRDKIGLCSATTNRHFRFLKELFEWVERKVPTIGPIYWDDLIEGEDNGPRDARPALAVEQVEAIFRLPVWTGCRSEARRYDPGGFIFHDSGYWVPLLLWYHGARRAEVCKPLCSEVRESDGIHYIVIDFTEIGRLKNQASRRELPLHPEPRRVCRRR